MHEKYYTASEIAELVNGKVIGNVEAKVNGIASLKEARQEDISFLANKKYSSQVPSSKAGIIIVGKDFNLIPGKTFIVCENPNLAFSKVINLFAPEPIKFDRVIHPTAIVAKTAIIGANVHIGPHVVIEDGAVIGDNSIIAAGTYIGHFVKIGKDCLIYPNVSIRERCIIGNRVIIHCGAVIGSDGFGFEATPQGIIKIEQHGIVEIGDDVEIGANCTIDRARFGKTILKQGVKLDNLVQVAHNVVIGEYSMLIGQSGVAGSTEIGRGVILAAQGGISGHLQIGDGVKIAGQAGVTKDVPPGQSVVGTPAESPKEFIERMGLPKKVRALSELIKNLEKRVIELEEELSRLKEKKRIGF